MGLICHALTIRRFAFERLVRRVAGVHRTETWHNVSGSEYEGRVNSDYLTPAIEVTDRYSVPRNGGSQGENPVSEGKSPKPNRIFPLSRPLVPFGRGRK